MRHRRPGCSIATGKPSETRGRLVRREALEIALYTFKFVPAIKSIVAFMPPPAGPAAVDAALPAEGDLTKQLDQPLRKTLPLEKPPLPTAARHEGGGDDRQADAPGGLLVQLQQLQDASALLVLNPFQTVAAASVALDEREGAAHASSDASAYSSNLRSKKLCGAPS